MPQYSVRAQCCRNEKETHSIDSLIAVNADIPERKCMSSWIMEERCSSFLIKVAVQAAGQVCNAGALMLHPFWDTHRQTHLNIHHLFVPQKKPNVHCISSLLIKDI